MKGRTIYVRTKEFGRFLRNNNYHIEASTGPYPNITGMRKLFWGGQCTIIKSGVYAYKVH